jgi:hypothetical protein
MIDIRTLLVEATSFLHQGELMMKFREILGLDGKDPLPEYGITAGATSGRIGWDKNIRALKDMGYKTSYKKISNPVSAPGRSVDKRLIKVAGAGIVLGKGSALQISPQ